MYYTHYQSPIGLLTIASNGQQITGLWMEGQKYFRSTMPESALEMSALPLFTTAISWLEDYFHGNNPDLSVLPLQPNGTPYQQIVWAALQEIPYGMTCTYGCLAKRVEEQTGARTSARAVGNAAGRNPISILIPCHRVVGKGQKLTGYAGGIDRKTFLLHLERQSTQPLRHTAPSRN